LPDDDSAVKVERIHMIRVTAQLLRLKEFPFLFATMITALGWLIVHITDRIEQAPTIEYAISEKTEHGSFATRCRIRNISRSDCFKEVRVFFNKTDGRVGEFRNSRILSKAPAHCESEPTSEPDSVTFRLEQLHPGWELTLFAEKTQPFESMVVFKTEGDTKGIRFIKAGLETFVARHEMIILCAILSVLALASFYYLIWLNRQVANMKAGP
jgi:hypothetical protein